MPGLDGISISGLLILLTLNACALFRLESQYIFSGSYR